jgi:hypothetical protein
MALPSLCYRCCWAICCTLSDGQSLVNGPMQLCGSSGAQAPGREDTPPAIPPPLPKWEDRHEARQLSAAQFAGQPTCTARCPKPPTPTMPTCMPGRVSHFRSGAYTASGCMWILVRVCVYACACVIGSYSKARTRVRACGGMICGHKLRSEKDALTRVRPSSQDFLFTCHEHRALASTVMAVASSRQGRRSLLPRHNFTLA